MQLPASLLREGVVLPNFAHWTGLNDRFAAGDAKSMLHSYMRQFEAQFSGDAGADVFQFTNVVGSEGALCKQLVDSKVRVAMLPACLVRVRGDGRAIAYDADLRLGPGRRLVGCPPTGCTLGEWNYPRGPPESDGECYAQLTRAGLLVEGEEDAATPRPCADPQAMLAVAERSGWRYEKPAAFMPQ